MTEKLALLQLGDDVSQDARSASIYDNKFWGIDCTNMVFH